MQTGVMEKASIAVSAGDSGAKMITLTSGEDKLGDDYTTELQKRNYKVVKYNNAECDKETQTETCTLPVTGKVVRVIGWQSPQISVSSKNANLKERFLTLFSLEGGGHKLLGLISNFSNLKSIQVIAVKLCKFFLKFIR